MEHDFTSKHDSGFDDSDDDDDDDEDGDDDEVDY
jgi:hypothetical protein